MMEVLTVAVMFAKPHSASSIHHHGEEGTGLQKPQQRDAMCIESHVQNGALI